MHPSDVLHYGDRTLLYAVRDLTEDEWQAPGVCGVWSVREIIAHLASFELALVEALAVARGEPTGPTLAEMLRDGQAFNDKQVAARMGLSVAETLAEYKAAHRKVMELAAALPPNLYINTGFLSAYGMEYDLEDFITYTYYGHKREHAAQIMVYRDGIGR